MKVYGLINKADSLPGLVETPNKGCGKHWVVFNNSSIREGKKKRDKKLLKS